MGDYDCTEDVMEHKALVKYWLDQWAELLKARAVRHDDSKLKDPVEKALFDHWTPELRRLTFGSDEYKLALDGMGEGVQRHYKANRHHPEHYKRGVNDMTLLDVMEMVADWMAAARKKGTYVDLNHAAQRFGLSEQLVEIIANTLREEDVWSQVNGGGYMSGNCPPDRYKGHVEGFEDPK